MPKDPDTVVSHTDLPPRPGPQTRARQSAAVSTDEAPAVAGVGGEPGLPSPLRCCAHPLVWAGEPGWVHLATGLPLGHHPDRLTHRPAPESAELDYAAVAAALQTAAAGTGLRVVEHPELPGARLVGQRGEAYLLIKPYGIAVELWRPNGEDAYRIERLTSLDTAVAVAVEALLDAATRRAWHTRHPGAAARPPPR